MKNILLIGANGNTSAEIIPRLLQQDDVRLTLFSRRIDHIASFQSATANIIQGDALNVNDLIRASADQDIVISTLGGLDIQAKTANIIAAMKQNGVKRLILISIGGIYDELPEPFNTWDRQMVGHYREPNLSAVEMIEQSGLDYTVLRPLWLTNQKSESAKLVPKGEMFGGTQTSRASIAKLIAGIVQNPSLYLNENLGMYEPGTQGSRPIAYR